MTSLKFRWKRWCACAPEACLCSHSWKWHWSHLWDMKEMLVKVSRVCGVRKGKWRHEMFFRGPACAGAEVPCFSEGETATDYAGIWLWRMTLAWRSWLQYCDFQQQKALSPDIQLENTEDERSQLSYFDRSELITLKESEEWYQSGATGCLIKKGRWMKPC